MSTPVGASSSGPLLLVVIGKGDALLYEANLLIHHRRENLAVTAADQLQCLAALEPLDIVVWNTPHMYCKSVDKFGKSFVSAFVTFNHTRILLLHRQFKNEDLIRHFLQEVHELILRTSICAGCQTYSINPIFSMAAYGAVTLLAFLHVFLFLICYVFLSRNEKQYIKLLTSTVTVACICILVAIPALLVSPKEYFGYICSSLRCDSIVVVIISVVILPALSSQTSFKQWKTPTSIAFSVRSMLPALVPLVIWTVSLVIAGEYLTIPKTSWHLRSWMSRLAVVGVVEASFLAGFASVSFPWKQLTKTLHNAELPSSQDLESELRDILMLRRQMLHESGPLGQDPYESVFEAYEGDEEMAVYSSRSMPRVKKKIEVDGLTNLAVNHLELIKFVKERESQKPLSSFWSRVFAWGLIIICCYRIICSVVNVTYGRSGSQVAPVTSIMKLLVRTDEAELDIELYTSYMTLGHTGFLVWTTVQNFFGPTNAFFQRYLKGRFNRDSIQMVKLQLQCLYFAACALLLNAHLPAHQRYIMNIIFDEKIDSHKLHMYFDSVFIGASILSGISLLYSWDSMIWKLKRIK